MTTGPGLAEKQSLRTWLFNPFHYVAGGTALAVGVPVVVVASFNGWLSNSHFDGVLDFHTGLETPPLFSIVEGLTVWIVASVFLLCAGWLISKSKIRAIDVFGTQALARVPTLVTAALAMFPAYQRVASGFATPNYHPHPADVVGFGVVALGSLAMIVWTVVLMYRGFATSCNVSGGKAVGVFAVALLVAEIGSKLVWAAAIYPLLK